MDIETVAEVMWNCWGGTYEEALAEVQSYYADGAIYDSIGAEWIWP